MNDIKNRYVLGVPIAHVHVIEFQKRGLPHCHMLIILRDEDKLRDSNDIDRIISAEIPDKNEDPELYEVVKSCMIHVPCGLLNPKSVCMENGTCKKKREQTNEYVNGYPAYRRRNNGRTVTVGRYVVDNRYVVPYNAHLLKKYRAHINIEACAKVMLLGGDFRQVLPVVPRATETVVIDTCLKRSILWQHFQQIKLTQNMHTNQGEQEFSKWLLELGNGTLIADLDPPMRDIIEIPDLCVVRESIVYDYLPTLQVKKGVGV